MIPQGPGSLQPRKETQTEFPVPSPKSEPKHARDLCLSTFQINNQLKKIQDNSKELTHVVTTVVERFLREGIPSIYMNYKHQASHLVGKAIFIMQVSINSPWRSVQEAKSQRWS